MSSDDVPQGSDVFTCPSSFAQQRLWFLDRLLPGSSLYNVPAALRLRAAVDADVLERAANELVCRHETLRTTFRAVAGEPVQVVHREQRLAIGRRDLRSAGVAAAAEAQRLAEAEARAPFDLERGPLLRLHLLQLAERDFVLLVTMHHIVSDGWSTSVFFDELTTLYDAFAHGEPSPLPELPVQYADYAVWQRERLAGEALERHLAFWRQRLDGAPLLQLPTDRRRPAVPSFQGDREPLRLDAALAAAVDELSREQGVTPFMTLFAVFALLLSRYSGQQDLVIGTLAAGRDRLETEGIIGFFVNTLVLRVDAGGNPSFRDWLARVRDAALDAYAHAEVPFERLVEALQPERDVSRNPLVQVTFQVFNPPGARRGGEERAELLDVRKGTAKFDLALELWEEEPGAGLAGRMEYSTDLFDAGTVRRMLGHFETLLRGAVAAPDRRIGSLPLLTPAETYRQAVEWNRTARPASDEACVHDWIAAQAHRTPRAVAVVAGREEWTYEQLEARANAVAWLLRERRVGPETLVGVCLQRSPLLVAALLGIWKAGGAYVPLDPAYPAARLRLMLADAGARLVLTQGPMVLTQGPMALAAELAGDGIEALELGPLPAGRAEPPAPAARPHHLAYLLYTSGSTGTPKGVAIEHRSTRALVEWALEQYSREELAGVLASTSVCFDLSVFELFAPLCAGGTVVIAETALHLPELPAARRLTLINTVPSALAALVRARAIPPGVRVLNVAGEPLTGALVEAAFAATAAERIHNLYGPTEDTTYSTGAVIRRGERGEPTIGRPLPRRQAYVLDAELRPAPVGVVGELHLAGAGLARGYWRRPELTAERFVPSPFATGARLYCTGDLARYRADGEIELLGRRDRQVKLRGFRIELGEVEAALRACPGVDDTAVLVDAGAGGDPQLAAWVAAGPAAALDGAALRRALEGSLPRHLVPTAWHLVDRLPLSPNGKVDRQALLAGNAAAGAAAARPSPAPPRTRLERSIAEVWCRVLGVDEVGVDDSFFEVGGHSLLMLRVYEELREIAADVPLIDLFRYPTVAALAEHLSRGSSEPPAAFAAARQRAARQRARRRQPEAQPSARSAAPWNEST